MRINELNKADKEEFFIEIIRQDGLDYAIECVEDNNALVICLVFSATAREEYWRDLYRTGCPKIEMTLEEIERKLNLTPNTLVING